MSKAAHSRLGHKGRRLVRQKDIEQQHQTHQQPTLETSRRPAKQLTRQLGTDTDVPDAEFMLQEAPQRVSVLVSLVTLVCCGQKTVWRYRTHGLSRLGQNELLLLLEHIAIDGAAPSDAIDLFAGVLKRAKEGSTVGDLDHTVFQADTSFLGSHFIGGVLYFLESGQCFHGLVHPADFGSLLVCRLVHRRELPYLMYSPSRLLLRLGLEDGVYPCGLVSNRYRPPVFYDPAHSVMSMFRDVLPLRHGLMPRLHDCNVTLESSSGNIIVSVSGRRQPELAALLEVYAPDTDGVLALAGELCQFADAHLVARETPGGDFETLLFSAAGRAQVCSSRLATAGVPAVTGLSFIALSARLATTNLQGSLAAVVEDGVGVVCGRRDMWSLLQSLHDAEDCVLPIDWLFLHDRRGPLRSASIRFVWRHLPGE